MTRGSLGDTEDFANAVLAGDSARVEGALEGNPALASARNADAVSLICVAVYMGHRDLARRLARDRSDLDVFEAACLGRLDRVRAWVEADPGWLSRTSPDGFHPLGYAAFFGHPELLEWLVERGAPVDAASRNAMAVRPIHSAVAARDPDTAVRLARVLVAAGADVNARQQGGYTPLHEAAHNGNPKLVELLLQHGADPFAVNDEGADPAALAADQGHDAVARTLRDRR